MSLAFKIKARALAATALGAVFAVADPLPPSTWAAGHLVVPDGPRAGDPWDGELTPYIKEPLDFLGPDSVVNEIAVRKSAQTGFTTLLIAAIGHSIDRDPCRMMLVQPTDGALSDFNREKLQPAFDTTPVLKGKVEAQTSRSGQGSTSYSKKFPKGSLTLAISTSAADLSSKTVKKLFRDEIDRYPDDVDGQGDPLDVSDGRLLSFMTSGDWKKADISTPTVAGASKITTRYEAGDQRLWHMPCPGCGGPFHYEAGPLFRFEPTFPHRAHYVTPCCGTIIEQASKNAVMRRGHWVATAPRPGAFPSYHCDVFISPFVPFDEIAKTIVAAGDNPQKLKALWNLWWGLAYEFKGDAPDHVRLMERREDFPRGHVPPRGLMLVAAADVQMRGIWVEIKAFAPDRQAWTVDAFYIDGDTSAPDEGAFAKLATTTLDRGFPDAFGGTRGLDALGVDSGYRSHVVYAWVRRNQRVNTLTGRDMVLALDGRDGWGKPPMGSPKLVDIDLAGHKLRKGCQLWPVGTWPIKGAFYEDLRKEGIKAGAAADPGGYQHFGTWQDEAYFKQITAEYLTDEIVNGRVTRKWKIKASERDNHWLDCAVYNVALAEYLGLSILTAEQWAAIARERGVPEATLAGGLFATPALRTAADPAPPQSPPPPAPTPSPDFYSRLAALNAED